MFKIDTKDIPYEMFEWLIEYICPVYADIESKNCDEKRWTIPIEAIRLEKVYGLFNSFSVSDDILYAMYKEYPKETREMIDKHPQKIKGLKVIKRYEIEENGLGDLDDIIDNMFEDVKDNIKKAIKELILKELEKNVSILFLKISPF